MTVIAHSEGNAHLQAKMALFEGRGKGFKKARALWAIESWADPADAPAGQGTIRVGNLDHPLYIVGDGAERPADEEGEI